ncbi:saccharopine dehydrogenase family protein [Nocardia nova]|uniref:saccharopine dehydrogenase family protein n=1 Tax=Nocardia nova TaxID=37330 RepID=UPI0034016C1B
MSSRIVVFGATGYTGELTVEALVAQGRRPVLAGRNLTRLESLADRFGGLDIHLADVSRPESIQTALEPGDVLISTVGPFLRWGDAAVEAAIGAGAHYVDSTGEPAFIRRVFEQYGPQAADRGCVLLTASGFDWVPGNLVGALTLQAAGTDAVRIELSYVLHHASAESGGARASTAAALQKPSFAYRGGRLVPERTARRSRRIRLDDGSVHAVLSAGGTEHLALPQLFPQLREVEVGLGLYGPAASRLVPLASGLVAGALRTPGLARVVGSALDRANDGSSGGPTAEERARGSATVIARAFSTNDSRQPLHTTTLTGVEGFTFTAAFLAWAASEVADGTVRDAGALGPVQAFGIDPLTAGVAASGLKAC